MGSIDFIKGIFLHEIDKNLLSNTDSFFLFEAITDLSAAY